MLWKQLDRRRARLGLALGPRPAGLAHRVLGHERALSRPGLRHPRRRPRPDLPAPRERDRPVALRPRHRRRWPLSGCTTASSRSRARRCRKSLGNFFTIHELLETDKFGGRKWPGEVLRLAHADDALPRADRFTVERLEEAEEKLRGWQRAAALRPRARARSDASVIDDAERRPQLPPRLGRHRRHRAQGQSRRRDRRRVPRRDAGSSSASAADSLLAGRSRRSTTSRIEDAVAERLAALNAKDFKRADEIRAALLAEGIQLMDSRTTPASASPHGRSSDEHHHRPHRHQRRRLREVEGVLHRRADAARHHACCSDYGDTSSAWAPSSRILWISEGSAAATCTSPSAPTAAAMVDAFYAAAIKAGGKDNGKPGLRTEYHRALLRRLRPRPGRAQHRSASAMAPVSGTLTGGCQCGAVRFSAKRLGRASICHCRMCQKAFGGFFGPLVTAFGVTWTRGEPAWFQSSNKVRRGFCGECGTPLAYDFGASAIELAIGAFDNPDGRGADHPGQSGRQAELLRQPDEPADAPARRVAQGRRVQASASSATSIPITTPSTGRRPKDLPRERAAQLLSRDRTLRVGHARRRRRALDLLGARRHARAPSRRCSCMAGRAAACRRTSGARSIRASYDVLLFDQRGCGKSTPFAEPRAQHHLGPRRRYREAARR